MKVVVLKESGSALALAFMVIFLMIFAAIFGFMLFSVQGGELIVLGFFAFFMAIVFFGIYALVKKRREYGRAQRFADACTFSDSGVSFPESLEFEYGTLELRGYWVGSGKNRSYHVEREFTPSKKSRASNVAFPEEGFKATVAFDGTGKVSVPAVRITDELYRDIVVLFFTDEGEVKGAGTVTVSTDRDSAQVNFRGEGRFITGTVYSSLNKARRVKVALTAKGFDYEKVIGKGKSFEFREPMLPEEKVIMVGTYGTVSPKLILSGFNGETVVMGHGEFRIRAILDIPLRPDIKAEESFRVELRERAEGEREEKEFEEEWGVF
ncbi:hypothetical protein A3L11_02680 [Thermococcus siculi]|uniref:Uncharacterized protein n=1 Tax=Thermococcus siculi TaxID=72803 RepID=A0A2Z2MK62_9EURY|nr:hypothetical protein [Thermococcus siculi]ASJ08188.1 hypothetical protein A3L11_02680 [Thermococcus siculi]